MTGHGLAADRHELGELTEKTEEQPSGANDQWFRSQMGPVSRFAASRPAELLMLQIQVTSTHCAPTEREEQEDVETNPVSAACCFTKWQQEDIAKNPLFKLSSGLDMVHQYYNISRGFMSASVFLLLYVLIAVFVANVHRNQQSSDQVVRLAG